MTPDTSNWPASRIVQVRCDVDIEQTRDSFHAHAVPDGIDIQPGDMVLVHDLPGEIGYGERIACECRATVLRANWLQRQWTQLCGMFELTELYDVGFEPRTAP